MALLEKLFDKLIDKSWIITCLSIILGFILSFFVPENLVEKIPFTDNWKSLTCIILCCIVVYIILYIIRLVYKKNISRKEKNEKEKNETEEIKTIIDELPNFDYSVITYLVKEGNKTPFVQQNYVDNSSILNDPGWFVKSPYTYIPESYGNAYLYKFLLTEKKYKQLEKINRKTGNLSHFNRTITDFEHMDN